MQKLFLATTNQDKIREYKQLFQASGRKLVKFPKHPKFPNVKETGRTFRENAVLKARAYGKKFNLPLLADDTGLEIKTLNGFPGLYSHRFARGNFPRARREILKRLKGVPQSQRRARFVCVIALFFPREGKIKTFTGRVNGKITLQEQGGRGFGYDPIFFVPSAGKTFAQMSLAQKNSLSHRGRATRKLIAFLTKSM